MAIFAKKSWQTLGKQCFLATFAKFGTITIWQEATLPFPAETRCETRSGFFCAIGLYFVTIGLYLVTFCSTQYTQK